MKNVVRIVFVLMLVASFFAANTSSVSATKQLHKAVLTTGAELHTVVGSSARGSFLVGYNLDGTMHFFLNVRNLSGPVGGAHIHGPATAEQTAGVLITLCGGPAPASVATCTVTDGVLSIEGNITSAQLAAKGLLPKDFVAMLNDGLAYVNVHTALNPAGEARGQIYVP